MTTTLCNSGSVKLAAGSNVSTSLTDSNYTEFINQAEGQLAVDTRVDWVSAWGTISGSKYAKVVEQAVAAWAAVNAIRYKMTAYSSLNEATTMINVNLNRYSNAVTQLKEGQVIKAIGADKFSS